MTREEIIKKIKEAESQAWETVTSCNKAFGVSDTLTRDTRNVWSALSSILEMINGNSTALDLLLYKLKDIDIAAELYIDVNNIDEEDY